jgi:hypothetical protein
MCFTKLVLSRKNGNIKWTYSRGIVRKAQNNILSHINCFQLTLHISLHEFTNDHRYVPLALDTSRSFPHSWLITGLVTRLTRRVSLVEQEQLTVPEYLKSSPVFSGFVLLDFQFYVYVLKIVVCPFVLFLLAVVLSVFLRFTDSDKPFDIFKVFLNECLVLIDISY